MAKKSKPSMRFTGYYVEDDGSESVTQRDSAGREWITNKEGIPRMHPDSVEIEKLKKADPRTSVRGQRGYSSGGKVRGCGAATKGYGKGTMR